LVTSAVIAKVHTIDWTVELLKTKTMRAAMRANWYGLLGKKIKDTFGHIGGPALGGLVGLKEPNNHGVPYSLTEEFTSVYRMHPLIPSTLKLRDPTGQPDANNSPPYLEDIDIGELVGLKGEEQLSKIGFQKQTLSMGYQACGALELWNYPSFFRDLIPQNLDGTSRSDRIDLAALEGMKFRPNLYHYQ
jgi:alpha-dioxygenase